jgi:hypothetical protein
MANTYVKLATVSVGLLGAANIEFTSIPATYTDLVVKLSSRTASASQADAVKVTFNGATANYSGKGLGADAGSGSAFSFNNTGTASLSDAYFTSTDANSVSAFGNGEIYICNYTTTNSKGVSGDSVTENNGTTAYPLIFTGLWSDTATINTIRLTPGASFKQYSSATLYGILKN